MANRSLPGSNASFLYRQDTGTSVSSSVSQGSSCGQQDWEQPGKLRAHSPSASVRRVPGNVVDAFVSMKGADGIIVEQDGQIVQLLLEKVLSLSAEQVQMQEQCLRLQKENQQLTNLVINLSDTLHQQQKQTRVLLQLQRMQLLKNRETQAEPSQVQLQQQQQEGDKGAEAAPAQDSPAPAVTSNEDDDVAVVSATLPSPEVLQRHLAQRQAASRNDLQQRVAEWLEERGWQEWQERLPLETVSSGSSSSLILALEECMQLHP